MDDKEKKTVYRLLKQEMNEIFHGRNLPALEE